MSCILSLQSLLCMWGGTIIRASVCVCVCEREREREREREKERKRERERERERGMEWVVINELRRRTI